MFKDEVVSATPRHLIVLVLVVSLVYLLQEGFVRSFRKPRLFIQKSQHAWRTKLQERLERLEK